MAPDIDSDAPAGEANSSPAHGYLAPKRHRGIYLLPNLFTTAAMFAGFYAVIAAFAGNFVDAAMAVFIAAILDALDGRIARLTNTQSAFGVQYDSLSDMCSFGLAPALVMYSWSLVTLKELGPLWGKVGWSAAFIYAACAALRLARFNTQVGVADKRYFQGLASPAAAGLLMSFLWTAAEAGIDGTMVRFVTPVLAVIAGLLMVSRVRYFSFKVGPKSDKVPFFIIPIAVLVLGALYIAPARGLLAITSLYVLSGPIYTLSSMRRMRGRRDGLAIDARQDAVRVEPISDPNARVPNAPGPNTAGPNTPGASP